MAEPLAGSVAVVLFAAGCGAFVGWMSGDTHGRNEEAAHRADPKNYPKGSCSELIVSCANQGGQMDFHQPRLTDETDEPTCNKWVQVKP